MMKIKKVGVIGCGLMGSGIAHVSARSGFPTIVCEANEEMLEKGIGNIFSFIDKGIERGKTTISERQQVGKNLEGTAKLSDLSDCNVIIEAVPEDFEVKRTVFSELDRIADSETIFASNTSSMKIKDLTATIERRERFLGTHFFNPVPIMKLVEVVRTDEVSKECYDAVIDWVKSLGKVPVSCTDTTGFIVNRLLNPYLLDAVRALEAGVAKVADIDTALKLGLGYPMGPLTLMDFIGLETIDHISGIMFEEFKLPQYESPRLLKKMVEKGLFGKKTGAGFYDYSSDLPVPNDETLKQLLS